MDVVADRMGGEQELPWMILESVLGLIGVGCVVLLPRVLSSKKFNAEDGIFGKSIPAADGYASHPVSSARMIQLFFNLPMILVFVIAAVQIISLIGMAWVYGYGT